MKLIQFKTFAYADVILSWFVKSIGEYINTYFLFVLDLVTLIGPL